MAEETIRSFHFIVKLNNKAMGFSSVSYRPGLAGPLGILELRKVPDADFHRVFNAKKRWDGAGSIDVYGMTKQALHYDFHAYDFSVWDADEDGIVTVECRGVEGIDRALELDAMKREMSL